MEPRDKDGRRKLKECENALRKQRFEEAITTPEVVMVSFKNPTSSPLLQHRLRSCEISAFEKRYKVL